MEKLSFVPVDDLDISFLKDWFVDDLEGKQRLFDYQDTANWLKLVKDNSNRFG